MCFISITRSSNISFVTIPNNIETTDLLKCTEIDCYWYNVKNVEISRVKIHSFYLQNLQFSSRFFVTLSKTLLPISNEIGQYALNLIKSVKERRAVANGKLPTHAFLFAILLFPFPIILIFI